MRRWTEQETALLRALYPDRSNAHIAELLHRSARAVNGKANAIGLRKAPAFYAQQKQKAWFRDGHEPHNKGLERKYWATDAEGLRRMEDHQYKRGHIPHNSRSPGYESLRGDSHGHRYWWIKPDDGRKMMPKHRWLWEQAYGPIPKGHCVQFRDGDTTNCVLENLYLIARSQQVRQNYDSLSDERKTAVRKKIHATRNESIKRDRIRIKWGYAPKTRLVKRVKT